MAARKQRVIVVDVEDADPILYRQTQRCLDMVVRLGVGNPDARAVLDLVKFVQDKRGVDEDIARHIRDKDRRRSDMKHLETLLDAHRRVVETARRGMVCAGCEHWPGGDMCPDDCVCKPLRCALAALDDLEASK